MAPPSTTRNFSQEPSTTTAIFDLFRQHAWCAITQRKRSKLTERQYANSDHSYPSNDLASACAVRCASHPAPFQQLEYHQEPSNSRSVALSRRWGRNFHQAGAGENRGRRGSLSVGFGAPRRGWGSNWKHQFQTPSREQKRKSRILVGRTILESRIDDGGRCSSK